MGTIYPPNVRNSVGSPVQFQWGPGAQAIIDGWAADFASIVGGETVTIAAGGGAPTVVTMHAGDTTAAAVAARINGVFPGLASVVDGHVRLTHATQVSVTATSNYTRIGLPIENRNIATPLRPYVKSALQPQQDRIAEFTSANYIDIPDNVNRLGLAVWIESPTGTSTLWGADFMVLWSDNAVLEGWTLKGAIIAGNDPVIDWVTTDDPMGSVERYSYMVRRQVSSAPGFEIPHYHEFEVPIGMKRARVYVRGMASIEATPFTPVNPPPVEAVQVFAIGYLGVRP